MSDDLSIALDRLGLADGATVQDVRDAYRRELRRHHPDVAGPGAAAHVQTALLIEAYTVLIDHAEEHGLTAFTRPTLPPSPAPGPTAGPGPAGIRIDADTGDPFEVIDAQALDEDTIAVDAPAPETFAALYEAAGRVGDVSYVDRQLGILEVIVRFEGGPSCSVVMTLQGRATYTEIFCTMESIEHQPTPPIKTVIDALVAELERV